MRERTVVSAAAAAAAAAPAPAPDRRPWKNARTNAPCTSCASSAHTQNKARIEPDIEWLHFGFLHFEGGRGGEPWTIDNFIQDS